MYLCISVEFHIDVSVPFSKYINKLWGLVYLVQLLNLNKLVLCIYGLIDQVSDCTLSSIGAENKTRSIGCNVEESSIMVVDFIVCCFVMGC